MKAAIFLLLFLASATLRADVVRPAPAFEWTDASGGRKSSRDFLGHPVIIVVADSPRQWSFRAQVGQLQKMYERLAAEKIICVAAFSQSPGIVRSNIPFVVVPDGPGLAHALGAEKGLAVAVVGKDGNLDYTGSRVVPAQRIYDILDNSYDVQKALRRP